MSCSERKIDERGMVSVTSSARLTTPSSVSHVARRRIGQVGDLDTGQLADLWGMAFYCRDGGESCAWIGAGQVHLDFDIVRQHLETAIEAASALKCPIRTPERGSGMIYGPLDRLGCVERGQRPRPLSPRGINALALWIGVSCVARRHQV